MRRLTLRALILAAILASEALIASALLDGPDLRQRGGLITLFIRDYGVWLVRGLVGFAVLFTSFAFLKFRRALELVSQRLEKDPIRWPLLLAHFGAVFAVAWMAAALWGGKTGLPQDLLAAGCIAGAFAAVILAATAVVPLPSWIELLRETRPLPAWAFGAAVVACLGGMLSLRLWGPATRVTFRMVQLILHPLFPDLLVQPEALRIGTSRFTVLITRDCSGLEGTALILVFALVWLFIMRNEIRFPQALALVPAAVVLLFVLNSFRIAALIVIGNAGARDIAMKGFHSQAGWMAFNLVAVGMSLTARRVHWFAAVPATDEFPAAPWLLPFAAILAAGMISRAASGSFEWLYPLRFVAAAAVLWTFRHKYRELDWSFGWTGVAAGVAVFVLWIGLDSSPSAAAPEQAQPWWIVLRVLAAVVTVPIAEELAFRGFLLRRLIAPDFEAVSFRTFTWSALIASSVLFGVLHGDRWMAGTAAGLAYAAASLRKGRIGEAVAAHAVTNGLLAAYVLVFQKWQFW